MTHNRGKDVTDDVDLTDGRNESLNERMDRNWNELLQELRVTQTGTQIFTGFLLTIAFQSRFNELTTFQVRIYLILVTAAMLLIFDLVVDRRTAFIVAGVTLIVLIILAALPGFLRSSRRGQDNKSL